MSQRNLTKRLLGLLTALAIVLLGGCAAPCGHGDTRRTVLREATCLEDGACIYICQDCGYVVKEESIPAAGHTWRPFSVVREPYLDTPGEEVRGCASCGRKESRAVICAHEETYTPRPVGQLCTEPRTRKTYCCRCQSLLRTETIPAGEHTYGEWQILEGIIAPGNKGCRFKKCQECGHTIDDFFDLPDEPALP